MSAAGKCPIWQPCLPIEPLPSVALIEFGRDLLAISPCWQAAGVSDHGNPRFPHVPALKCSMDHWRVELGAKDKYLGIVEAEDEDEAVEAAAEKFRVPASEQHMIR